MDQFRQIGEVLGSLKALMVLKHDISINQKQCCLLFDIFTLAFETIAEEIRQNLRLEDKNTKWKALEYPLRELHKIFKEGELYIKYCLEIKDWWGKAISLHQNKDCVELHIHNLFCCFPVVIEAIETAAEISVLDHDDMQKRRLMLMRKYDSEWNDLKLFQWKFGKQYLVPLEISNRLDNVWKEDRWFLLESVRERKSFAANVMAKHEQRLGDLLISKLSGSEPLQSKVLPSWILVGAKDYSVKRRLGSGRSHYKEIHWLGENFALRTFYGEIEPLNSEISLVLSISHPNVMHYFCAFYDEEKKEGFLVMELMQKNLGSYIKENCGQRKRIPFSISVAVDIMLQIARGMEYLHSQKIYPGDLNPSNVLLKARNSSAEGFFHAKLTGFGVTSVKSYTSRNSNNQSGIDPVIWYAPEVLAEQERGESKCSTKYTEKADVYSFAMICFELLTGKVPFEDDHLQGDKMVRNIRLGGRPLFPHPSPKYLSNLTKKCWQSKPSRRPSFSSICRILRYIKKVLVINPDHGQPDAPPPLVDYCDIEAGYSKKFPVEGSSDLASVSQIPFQMFAYKLVEKEKTSGKSWDMASEASLGGRPASIFGDENGAVMDDLFMAESDQRSVRSEFLHRKNSSMSVADLRSVFSEFPPRKSLLADQSSVCSESPRGKFLSFTEADHSPLYVQTPNPTRTSTQAVYRRSFSMNLGRKTSTADRKSVTYDIPEKKMLSTCDQNSAGSDTTETKFLSTAADELRSIRLENQEKIPSNATSDEKQVHPEASDGENLSGSTSDQKLISPETTVRKTVPKVAVQRSNCTVIPGKRVVSTTVTNQPTNGLKIPEKKVVLSTKKRKDTNTSKSASKTKGHTPRTSPAQALNGISSPRSSPARAPKEYSSSISSPARGSKEVISSLNSRCTRTHRENLVSSAMSPRRM